MDTHDIDGTNYQNERREFYAPQKEATIKLVSHAYRWVSGNIDGSCTQVKGDRLLEALPSLAGAYSDQSYPVDTIEIDSAGLFDTDSSVLTSDGRNLLEQVTQRLNSYEKILHLNVEGHTDSRGSFNYNDRLSQNRANTVAKSLQVAFPGNVITTSAAGEHRPLQKNTNAAQMAVNRRVSVTAVVDSAEPARKPDSDKPPSASRTLCQNHENSASLEDRAKLREDLTQRLELSLIPPYSVRPPLSAGDRLRIVIPEGDEISGIYEVGISGELEVPFIGLVSAQGLDTRVLESTIHDRLIEKEIFRPGMLKVSATVQEWAPVDVLVTGATFDPGRVTINRQKAEYRTFKQGHLSGDFAKERLLSAALYSAGGIRPDADLAQVQLIRSGKVIKIDFSGLFTGKLTKDIPLSAGDQVIVPSVGYFQSSLVRRSQITPAGVRIFISNLTVPALNNSQSAVNSSSTSMPYGTRFLHGLVSGNCIGGTQLTNASRRAVLISTNPTTGRTEVIERSIQQLVSDPKRDNINPFLMPNDGIACYDSSVTNFRDVTRTFAEFLNPILDLKSF